METLKLIKNNSPKDQGWSEIINQAENKTAFLVAVLDNTDRSVVDFMFASNLDGVMKLCGTFFTLGVGNVQVFRIPVEDYSKIDNDDWFDSNGKPLPGNPLYDINTYIQKLIK